MDRLMRQCRCRGRDVTSSIAADHCSASAPDRRSATGGASVVADAANAIWRGRCMRLLSGLRVRAPLSMVRCAAALPSRLLGTPLLNASCAVAGKHAKRPRVLP